MVCIGDFWAASEGRDDLIVRMGRMISYHQYNTKNPLNGLAASGWYRTPTFCQSIPGRAQLLRSLWPLLIRGREKS